MGLERVARQCVFFILIFSTYIENFYLYIHVFFHCNLFHLHLFYWSIWTYIVDKCLVLQRSTLILECSLGKSDLTKPVFTVCVLFYFSYTFFIILIYVSFWGGIDVYISSTIQRKKKIVLSFRRWMSLNCVWLSVTLSTTHSMAFSRPEYWSE